MKLAIKRNELQIALRKIINISSSSEEEVNKCLYLSCIKDKLLLSTTGNDIIAYLQVECVGEKDGVFLTDSKLFNSLITKLPKSVEDISLKTTTRDKVKYLLLSAGKNKYEFKFENHNFPKPITNRYFRDIEIPGEVLLGMLDKGAWAHLVKATEDNKKVFEYVQFKFNEDEFRIISSDLKKLACCVTNIETKLDVSFIVQHKMTKTLLGELNKIKKSGTRAEPAILPPVIISTRDDVIRFNLDNVNYVCNVPQYEYPDLLRLLKEGPYCLSLPKKELLKPIERLQQFTDNIKNMLVFEFRKGKPIGIRSFNLSSKQESREELSCKWAQDDLEIGFNGSLLVGIIKKMGSDNVIFNFTEPLKPFMVKPEGGNDIFLLQGLRID